jgi:hypothetical protein
MDGMKWHHPRETRTCEVCQFEFSCRVSSTTRTCSNRCRSKIRNYPTGPDHPRWKGGTITKSGYKVIQVEGKREYEHRAVMQRILGRQLASYEVVHHLNGNRLDNRPTNLAILLNGMHVSNHLRRRTDLAKLGQANTIVQCSCGCGALFIKYDNRRRPRQFLHGHNNSRESRTASIS